jgi:hypothetical protein
MLVMFNCDLGDQVERAEDYPLCSSAVDFHLSSCDMYNC